jgi:hypothetical protein
MIVCMLHTKGSASRIEEPLGIQIELNFMLQPPLQTQTKTADTRKLILHSIKDAFAATQKQILDHWIIKTEVAQKLNRTSEMINKTPNKIE